MTHSYVVYTWQSFEQVVDVMLPQLHHWVREQSKPRICAVARGGLIAATILSHRLNVPITNFIVARTYGASKVAQGETTLSESQAIPQAAVKSTLFVDDILDKGHTVKKILEQYPKAQFVIPIAKHSGLQACRENLLIEPVTTLADNVWVQFPWEVPSQI